MATKTGNKLVDQTIDFIRRTWGITFSQGDIGAWQDELASGTGRTAQELRLDLIRYRVGRNRVQRWVRDQFEARNGTIATANETEAERIRRIAGELISGDRTFDSTVDTLNDLFGPPSEGIEGPSGPDVPTPEPTTPEPDEGIPDAEPPPDEPDVEARDFRREAELLFPHLPRQLRSIFVEEWTRTGDKTLALAAMRAHSTYDQFFPGIKRENGTLRMTELEYAATLDAFDEILLHAEVNPALFQNRYEDWIRGDVSITEVAERVDRLHRRIINQDEGFVGHLAEQLGVEVDRASIMAAALDPELGRAIFDRELDVAEVRAEAFNQGFRVNATGAENLLRGFGNQGVQMARPFLGQAAAALPALGGLAARFDTRDQDVDLEEFAQAQLFRDATQSRRLARLLGQSRAGFTSPGLGARQDREGAVTGLQAR